MSVPNSESDTGSPNGSPQQHGFVSPEQYDLPRSLAQLKLSPLDMNMPRVYGTRWILCFPLSADANQAQIYEHLRVGLAHTIAAIPWIAGNVGPEEGSDPGCNRIQVIDGPGGVEFKYEDLTGILPSYVELKAQHFPLSKLSTEQLSPLGVMPQPPQPVMAAQANFIQGGLLLTIGVHHSVCDGGGVDTIIDAWARNTTAATSAGPYTAYDPLSNDRSRLTAASGANLADFPEYILLPTPRAASIAMGPQQMAEASLQLPRMTSHIFYFSPTSLASLKDAAGAHSTNDALLAFLWTHMTLARNPPRSPTTEISSEEGTTVLCFAANIRDRTSPPLPPTYLGNASVGVITKRLPTSALTADSGLKQAAAAIRSSVTALSLPNRVPLIIGLINSRSDPTDYKFSCNAFLGPDLVATSWTKFGIYDRSWGALGKPESFRVPGEGSDGIVIVLPRIRDGGLEVLAGLEDGAMQRLLGNGEFLKAARLWC